MQRIFTFLFFMCMAVTLVIAQELSVKSFGLSSYDGMTDLRGATHRRYDANGEPCALVQVYLVRPGAKFEGNVMGEITYSDGVYMVFMWRGSKALEVRLEGYLPVMVYFPKFGVESVEGLKAYNLVLSLSNETNQQTADSNVSIQGGAVFTPNTQTFTVNGVSFAMVCVDGGTFTMGATSELLAGSNSDEAPTHIVTLSDYMIGETEVTQELWYAVMGSNPSKYANKSNPVEQVSWEDCQLFISKLNSLSHESFRLPSEAEWEYAARGGNRSIGYKYSGADNLEEVAWYDGNSEETSTKPVKNKKANELGIYDMTGNVWEWCSDWKDNYTSNPQTNPKGAASGEFRINRGGSWISDSKHCRVSCRAYDQPDFKDFSIGLRLAL